MIHKKTLNSAFRKFEEAYLLLRKREDRIFNVQEISLLPDLPENHTHYSEWMKRKHSYELFSEYINQKEYKSILDLACGNGWFLNRLSSRFDRIVGVEVNELELDQAEKVLQNHEDLSLHLGDIFQLNLNETFDIITINAAIQYFQPFQAIINKLLTMLNKDGEIHILDSPFYPDEDESKQAKMRSEKYYAENKAAVLSDFYHHHTLKDLKKFNHDILYNPLSFSNRIKRKLNPQSPFHWIKIYQ